MNDLRVYPKRFVAQLYRAFYETEAIHQRRDLRHKNAVDTSKSDRELFDALPLGDLWSDCNMVNTYWYARENRRLVIPDSWQCSIDNFERELRKTVPGLNQPYFNR